MSRADLSSKACPVARAAAVVGDTWTIMILREMFLGSRRFDTFLRQTGMSSHLLSQRLKQLEADGVVRREAYSQRPLRHEYRLTPSGHALWPVIIAMKQWSDEWLGDNATAVAVVHKDCGHVTRPRMTCSECDAPLRSVDVEAHVSGSARAERQAADPSPHHAPPRRA